MKKKLTILAIATLMVGLLSVLGGLAIAHDLNCDCIVRPGEYIQDAIDAADPGDTICVEPGTYTQDLTITKSLNLVGLRDDHDDNGGGKPIIKGVATVPASLFPLAIPNIDIQASDVLIVGFVIESPEVAEDNYSSGIVLTGRDIKIIKNHFIVGTGDVSQAIQTYRQTIAPDGLRDISGLFIAKNTFTHLEPATGVGAYEGIFINPQSDQLDPILPANTIVITKNRFSGNLIRAITTQRSGTVITKNRMSSYWTPPAGLETFPRGIQLSKAAEAPPLPDAPSTDHFVSKNVICDKSAAPFATGILLRDGVTNSGIVKNYVKGPMNDGIYVDGGSNGVIKNHVKDSGRVGIHLGPKSEGNKVIKNRVKNSGTYDLQDEGIGIVNEFMKNKCDTSDPPDLCCSGR